MKSADRAETKSLISAYIITKNEEKNIERALRSVQWMDEIVVLDSGSTDSTAAIAMDLGAKVFTGEFKGYSEQKNRAMELSIGEWLFNLDADEEVSGELTESIREVIRGKLSEGLPTLLKVCRRTLYLGRWMRHCGWYPEFRARLCRKGCARWVGDMLHESLEGDGSAGILNGDLLHRPYGDLGEHIRTIDRYSELWARREHLKGRKVTFLDIIGRPCVKFVKMYGVKGGFLDGGPGFVASVMGAWYSFAKYARLYELTRNS